MIADLPPDVRDRAAQAAFRAYWERETVSGMAERHRRDAVDAVTAVVAPEITRPLQAENEMLRDRERVGVTEFCRIVNENHTLQARIAELEGRELFLQEQAGDMAEEIEDQGEALHARVELLTAALKKVTDYFASAPTLMSTGQWEALSNARAALAAGETESEAAVFVVPTVDGDTAIIGAEAVKARPNVQARWDTRTEEWAAAEATE